MGEFRFLIKNLTNKELISDEGSMIGTADMRSVGYFYMSRSTIQKAAEGRFVPISETDDEVLLQANEELVQVNEKDLVKKLHKVPRPSLKGQLGSCLNVKPNQEKSGQKEKYIAGFKVDPNSKYPWLDKDEPLRNMTDRNNRKIC